MTAENPILPETHGGFAMEYVPTRWERFWRALGYRSRYPDFPEEVELAHSSGKLPGWMATDIRLHVDFLDRLRLLVSGKAMMRVGTHTDSIVKEAHSVSTFEVMPPFERRNP